MHVVKTYDTRQCTNCIPFASQLRGSDVCKSCEKIGFCDFIRSDGRLCGKFKDKTHYHCGYNCGINCMCINDDGVEM
jgi:hypothetical protein